MNTKVRQPRARLLSVGILVLLLAGTVTTTAVLRSIVRDENRDLLHARTAEAGLVLSSALSSMKPSLQLLGATYAADPKSSVADKLTHAYAAAAGVVTAIATEQDGRLVIRVAAGSTLNPNQALTGSRAILARRAIAAKDLVSDVISHAGRDRATVAFAIALPNGVVIYQEVKVNPEQLIRSDANSPFNELEGELYVGPNADASRLLFSTAKHGPLNGVIDSRLLHIGADRWLLLTTANGSLAGRFAEQAPWIVFALGLLVSIAAFAAADLLLRRRAYALTLVEERTATLRQAVSDLEATRAAAQAANQAKSEFLSRMSHELRTPLNAVLGFAQVLELGNLNESERLSVAQITKGGQHLLGLINDVLDISRIETGNLTLSPEPVLAADVVDDVLDLVEPLAAQRDIRCSTLNRNESSFVFADRQRLKQILLNLLSNAVKYNTAGGTVTISYEQRSDERLRINVTDTGPGIPADQRELIFEPFERLGAEQTGVEGAGIGLALSRRLAEGMHGEVDVDSVVGKGSTFWIELQLTEGPVERHQRTTLGESIAPPMAQPDSPQHTILYIEDNVANVKLIEHVLDYRGDVHLITAMQGRLGIELARQHRPELVLLDLHLPDIGGEAVLTDLRAHGDTAAIPIIVLTADATERLHERLLAAGATAYLTKPIDVRQLLELVDQHLSTLTPQT